MDGPPIAPDDEPGWPLHQRLAGAGVRTAATGVALVPATIAVAADEGLGDAATFFGLALVVALPILALERRDRGVFRTLLWLFAGVVAGALLAPVAYVCVKHVGDPMAVMGELERALGRGAGLAFPIMAGVAGLVSAVFGGVVFVVRARTCRLGPQVTAGLMTVAGLASPLLREVNRREEVLAVLAALLSGALVPVGLVLSERWTRALDPRAPAPDERDSRLALAAFGLVMLLASALPAAMTRVQRWRGWMDAGPGTDLARGLDEAMLRAARLGSSPPRSMVELRWWGSPERSDVFVRGDDVFVSRLSVVPDGSRWTVVVDRLGPRGGDRSCAFERPAGVAGASREVHAHVPLGVDPDTGMTRPAEPP